MDNHFHERGQGGSVVCQLFFPRISHIRTTRRCQTVPLCHGFFALRSLLSLNVLYFFQYPIY